MIPAFASLPGSAYAGVISRQSGTRCRGIFLAFEKCSANLAQCDGRDNGWGRRCFAKKHASVIRMGFECSHWGIEFLQGAVLRCLGYFQDSDAAFEAIIPGSRRFLLHVEIGKESEFCTERGFITLSQIGLCKSEKEVQNSGAFIDQAMTSRKTKSHRRSPSFCCGRMIQKP